jgi:glycosyltransferase involved in cell wall biosynthesis
MKVSVVMITYKHEAYIEQALRSILDQDYAQLKEVLVADDCSPDRTNDIVRALQTSHPRGRLIRYIRHKKNIGFQQNFKLALEQASGEFIALCEGDDFWNSRQKLTVQLDVFQKHPDLQLVASTSYICSEDNTVTEQSEKYKELDFPYTLTIDNFLDPYVLDTNTLVLRNNFSLQNVSSKGFKDIVLIALALAKGNGIMLAEPLGTYRLHATGNWTAKSTDEKYIENLASVNLLYHLFNKNHIGLYAFIRNCFRHAYPLILEQPKQKKLTITYATTYYKIKKEDWSFNKFEFLKQLLKKLIK